MVMRAAGSSLMNPWCFISMMIEWNDVGPLTIDAKMKEFLLCPDNAASCLPPIPPEGFQFLVIAQNLVSITCVFFIGLALRNYFKIKWWAEEAGLSERKQGHGARRKAAARSERAPPVTSSRAGKGKMSRALLAPPVGNARRGG
jgi:hypothetical protein